MPADHQNHGLKLSLPGRPRASVVLSLSVSPEMATT